MTNFYKNNTSKLQIYNVKHAIKTAETIDFSRKSFDFRLFTGNADNRT